MTPKSKISKYLMNNDEYYNYQNSLNDNYNYDRFHFFDYVLMLISAICLVCAIFYGVVKQNQVNEITKKQNDIEQVVKALDMYYVDSSKIPSQRKYPIAVCNGKPNEVDFEYTLKNALAGKVKSQSNFAYIKPNDFPIDTSGEYALKLAEKKVKLRDCPKIFGNTKTKDYIYPDQSQSCNFESSNPNNKYRSCYIYASDNLGFQYQIGFFDQYKNTFTIYTKTRDQPPQVSVS
jgi:hypothetical protein